jgi:hypothetical protein
VPCHSAKTRLTVVRRRLRSFAWLRRAASAAQHVSGGSIRTACHVSDSARACLAWNITRRALAQWSNRRTDDHLTRTAGEKTAGKSDSSRLALQAWPPERPSKCNPSRSRSGATACRRSSE